MDLALATLLGFLAGIPAGAQDGAAWAPLAARAKVGLLEAVEKGRKEAGEGVVFHAELEGSKRPVYSIDVAIGGKTVNVLVDAVDGSVVEKEDEAEDHSAETMACPTTIAAAVRAALEKAPGSAVEAEVVLRAGKPRIEVKIVREAMLSKVLVDGSTGKVLEGPPAGEEAFTESFPVEEGELGPTGANRFFILEPGTVLVLEGKDEGKAATLTISVLEETRKVAGVETRVVEERETLGGKLIEVSRNFFAISRRTNSVYYFGEEVDLYEDGKVVGHEGAWLAGEKGARFGIMMPGTPLLGSRYYQEIAPGVAMDRAEIVGLEETVQTPAGILERCLKTEETTPLESGREAKAYAPGIGIVLDGPLRLTKIVRAKK